MGLFGKKKGTEEHSDAPVKILGSGCAKCNALEEITRQAKVEQLDEWSACSIRHRSSSFASSCV